MRNQELKLQCQGCGRVEAAYTVIDEGWRYLLITGIPLVCPTCLPQMDVPDEITDRKLVNDFQEFRDIKRAF